MGHVPLLDELAIVAALAVAVTVILSRLQLPTLAGLLAAGALLGPHGLRLASSVESIEALAEVGVVLLLFSIGLEFSLARLRDIFRLVVAVRRHVLVKPDPTVSFRPGDVVSFVGTSNALTRAMALFDPEPYQAKGDAA